MISLPQSLHAAILLISVSLLSANFFWLNRCHIAVFTECCLVLWMQESWEVGGDMQWKIVL